MQVTNTDPQAFRAVLCSRMSEIERVRELVMAHGWNTTCYQLVNPGIRHWFAAKGDAVVGFVRKAGVTIVAGAPVCEAKRLSEVVEEFEASHGPRVCYFGAEERMVSLAANSRGYSIVSVGSQPACNPDSWIASFDQDPSLRAQVNRARNKGVTVREWAPGDAEQSTALSEVLSEWIATRGLPPLHFLVEPQTLAYLAGRKIYVAERNDSLVGFTILSPIPKRLGWLTEQFVRGDGAPNGTVELMVDAAIRSVAAEGSTYVTMGIVPLSRKGAALHVQDPRWLRFVTGWVRAHGRRFYNFDGLEWFKSKFHPDEWEPVYIISKETHFSFRTLYAISAAFTQQPPGIAIVKGLGRAIRQEWKWLKRSKRASSRSSSDRP